MRAGIDAFGLESLEVGLGTGRQRQEVHQQALLACALALRQELACVVGVLDVLVPIHAARMARDELVAVIDAHAIGIGLERQALTGVARTAPSSGWSRAATRNRLVARTEHTRARSKPAGFSGLR